MHERWPYAIRCSALAMLLLGAGCGPRSGSAEPPTPNGTTASVAPTTATTAATADAPSTETISGRIRAYDGTPLKTGEVTVMGAFEPITTSLDETGAFSLEAPLGVVFVLLAGVDHAPWARRTLLSGPFSVEGTLGTRPAPPPEPTLAIVGQFLDAEGQPVGPAPSSAARVREGVYQLDLSGRPEAATALRYPLRPPTGRPFNGPVADRYSYDGRANFYSIVDLQDRGAVELELATMPSAKRSAELRWSGEDEATVAIFDFERRWKAKLGELEGSESPPDPAAVAALRAEARAEVDAVTDPTVQGLLRGAHVTVFGPGTDDAPDPVSVHVEAAWLIEHVAPDDIHLGLLYGIDGILSASLESDADTELITRTLAWLERRAAENPDAEAAVVALRMLLSRAEQDHDEARLAELIARLEDPRFEGHPARRLLAQQYGPNRALQVGKTLPQFEYAALAADAPPVDNAGRAGHIYLLEFWATWCEPCVEDMPNLHRAYAAINGANKAAGDDKALRTLAAVSDPVVEFVFVSVDTDPGLIVAFREEHWSMPWTHAHAADEQQRPMMEALGRMTLPTSVLVDERGTILVTDQDALHGEQLLPTLQRVLAEREAAG